LYSLVLPGKQSANVGVCRNFRSSACTSAQHTVNA
jgi:hypothetical protein